MLSICLPARRAPRAPSSASDSSRARRERTSAYSAITKNALTSTSTAVRMMSRAFTTAQSTRRANGASVCPLLLRGGSSFIVATAGTVAGAGADSAQAIDGGGEPQIGLGHPTRGVGAERHTHSVVAMDQDVR